MEAGALQAGLVVDRWTVEAPIGEGGMATVWRVRHNRLGTVHALKVLSIANPESDLEIRRAGTEPQRRRRVDERRNSAASG